MVHLDLSVHDIVDLILRTGDLDSRIFNRSTMNEGTKLHQVYQRKYAQSGYQAEVGLTHDMSMRMSHSMSLVKQMVYMLKTTL